MPISEKRQNEIESIRDDQIDYSDIPATDEQFWAEAELRAPETKKAIYLRLDADLLDWLKSQGKGYQTRINVIPCQYMDAHKQT